MITYCPKCGSGEGKPRPGKHLCDRCAAEDTTCPMKGTRPECLNCYAAYCGLECKKVCTSDVSAVMIFDNEVRMPTSAYNAMTEELDKLQARVQRCMFGHDYLLRAKIDGRGDEPCPVCALAAAEAEASRSRKAWDSAHRQAMANGERAQEAELRLVKVGQTRFRRFWCWLLTGHRWDQTDSSRLASRSMNRCKYCDTVEAGPD